MLAIFLTALLFGFAFNVSLARCSAKRCAAV